MTYWQMREQKAIAELAELRQAAENRLADV